MHSVVIVMRAIDDLLHLPEGNEHLEGGLPGRAIRFAAFRAPGGITEARQCNHKAQDRDGIRAQLLA